MIKGKMAILKPNVWNKDGYRWPSPCEYRLNHR